MRARVLVVLAVAMVVGGSALAGAHPGPVDSQGGHPCDQASADQGLCGPAGAYHCMTQACEEALQSGRTATTPPPRPPSPPTTPPPAPGPVLGGPASGVYRPGNGVTTSVPFRLPSGDGVDLTTSDDEDGVGDGSAAWWWLAPIGALLVGGTAVVVVRRRRAN